jgi:anti-sigma factor RsiW
MDELVEAGRPRMRVLHHSGGGCERTWKYLDYYVSDELSIETSLEVSGHLKVCRACSSEVETRRYLRDRLRAAVQGEPVPPDLRGRVAKRVRPSNMADVKFSV